MSRSYAQATAAQPVDAHVQEGPTLGAVMVMLRDVMARLMFLEKPRGPDQARQTHTPRGDESQGPAPRVSANTTGPRITAQQSDNTDFVSVSKCLYRQVQIEHHADNWRNLPESLGKRLKKFASDIKPPMAEDGTLRTAINAATEAFGRQICKIVGDHLESKRAANELEGSKLDNRDLDRAKAVAAKYLTTRLGKRIDGDRMKTRLDRAAQMIGTARSTASGTVAAGSKSPARPVASATAVATDADGFKTPARSVVRTTAEGLTTKRRRAESSPTETKNRFDGLEIEELCCTPEGQTKTARSLKKPRKVADPGSIATHTRQSTAAARDQCQQTPVGVFVHEGPKDKWSLKPADDTKVLVIGDSNLRSADAYRTTPDGWEVHSFPGGKLQHVTSLVSDMPCPPTLEHIVVQVGINHRQDDVETTNQQIARLEQALEGFAVKASVTGISVAKSLNEMAKRNVVRINQTLKDCRALHYIAPLAENEVVISPTDGMGIHYDGPTIDRIISSMVEHVQCLN